jgi:hypothetical protein
MLSKGLVWGAFLVIAYEGLLRGCLGITPAGVIVRPSLQPFDPPDLVNPFDVGRHPDLVFIYRFADASDRSC